MGIVKCFSPVDEKSLTITWMLRLVVHVQSSDFARVGESGRDNTFGQLVAGG
ncbi:MAG: hypothetical protein WEC36_06800 [Phycisphaeraceae bacterium]